MQVASLKPEHNASGWTMQVAYARRMKESEKKADVEPKRPYRLRRMAWLNKLLSEYGGPSKLAVELETQATYLTAMSKGTRNVGDEIADRMETLLGLDAGDVDLFSPGEAKPEMQQSPIYAGLVADYLTKRLIRLDESQRAEIGKRVTALITSPDSSMTKQALVKALAASGESRRDAGENGELQAA